MAKGKVRVHSEWFQEITSVATCPCGSRKRDRIKAGLTANLLAWGNYISGKWYTIDYCCQVCFSTRVIPQLLTHASGCGCTFQLNARSGHNIPPWVKMPDANICKVA